MTFEDWQPWETAPKDGRWIIALCNDRSKIYRVSWGVNRKGDTGWCTETQSFGDGLFFAGGGWIDWPSTAQIGR